MMKTSTFRAKAPRRDVSSQTYEWFAKYIFFLGVENNTMIDDATTCCYGNNDRVRWETKDIARIDAVVVFCGRIYWQAALKFTEKSENKRREASIISKYGYNSHELVHTMR